MAPSPRQVAVVDPVPVYSLGLAAIVSHLGMEPTEPVNLFMWADRNPNGVVLLTLRELDDFEQLAKLLAPRSELRVVALPCRATPDECTALVDIGVRGVVCRNATRDELLLALQTVSRGGTYVTPGAVDGPSLHLLTSEQITLLEFLALGWSRPRVARHLRVSRKTVDRRVRSVCSALGASTVAQALVGAASRGLIRPAMEKP